MQYLDLSNMNCPLPVLKTKKFLANLSSGEQVHITTTDAASKDDLADFCTKSNNILKEQYLENNKIITIIERK